MSCLFVQKSVSGAHEAGLDVTRPYPRKMLPPPAASRPREAQPPALLEAAPFPSPARGSRLPGRSGGVLSKVDPNLKSKRC